MRGGEDIGNINLCSLRNTLPYSMEVNSYHYSSLSNGGTVSIGDYSSHTNTGINGIFTGEHISMLDTMAEVRNQLGAPPDDDEDDDSKWEGLGDMYYYYGPDIFAESGELSMVEQILKVVSRELSVVEVMQVFKGQVEPAQRLQPSLFNFVRDKLLDGAEPTKQRCDQAVAALLTNCRPSIEAVKVSLCM